MQVRLSFSFIMEWLLKVTASLELLAFFGYMNLKPSLLLWWLRYLFGKELVRRVVITNIPKVLGHGHDKRSNHQDGKDCSVFSFFLYSNNNNKKIIICKKFIMST